MTCRILAHPATEGSVTRAPIGTITLPIRPRRAQPIASNELERLAQLMISNDELMDSLVTSRAKIVAARNYLDRPDCNLGFAAAHLERCRASHTGVLAQLRANRIEALHLLGDGKSGE